MAQLAASHIVCSALSMGYSSSLSLAAAHSKASSVLSKTSRAFEGRDVQQPAAITLEQPAATLDINMTPARESLGYCGIAAQQRVFHQEALAASDAGIDRRVQEVLSREICNMARFMVI